MLHQQKNPQSFQSFFSRQILPNLNPFLNSSPFHHPKTLNFSSKVQGATLQGATRSEVVQKAVEVPKRPSDRPGFWGDISIGGGFFGARNDSPPNDPKKTHLSQTSPLGSPDLPPDRSLSASNFLNICPIRAQSQFLRSNHYVALGWLYWSGKTKGKGGTLFFVLFRLLFHGFLLISPCTGEAISKSLPVHFRVIELYIQGIHSNFVSWLLVIPPPYGHREKWLNT